MKLSIIIPVFNESETVKKIIEKISAAPLMVRKEIIVIDDGSSDNTWDIVNSLSNKYGLILAQHTENVGKGAAIITGLKRATGEFVIIQDADLEYNPNEYQNLLNSLIKNKAKVVYGSRNLGSCRRGKLSFYWGGKLVTFIANTLYGLNITDEPTCYKLFDRNFLNSLNLQCRGFEFCPEVTAKIARRGARIFEVPISYSPRSKSEGKKIKWRDGVIAIWTLLKYRFKKF